MVNREEQDDLKVKKAWEIAIAPAKTYLHPSPFPPFRCPSPTLSLAFAFPVIRLLNVAVFWCP
jgi:hypothetical protein